MDAETAQARPPGPGRGEADSDGRRAVTDLFREHHLELVRLAVLMTGDLATAEDVVQDAFEHLHRSWRRLRTPGSGLAYARTSVVNGCRMAHRRSAVARRYAPRLAGPDAASPDAAAAMADESEMVAPARRRGGARRWLAPAAALVAVGLVATVIGVVAGDRLGSGPVHRSPSASPAPSATAPAAAAMPPFYVATGPGQSTRLVVRASANGAITADLTTLPDVPGVLPDDRSPVVVGLAAAAADDRTFVISFHRQQVAAGSATITWFYRLTLNPDGTLSGLHKLPLTIPPGAGPYQAYAMALSPDGGTLAVAVDVVPGDQTRQPATGHASIEVVSLRTGARRTWTAPASTELQNLSWVSSTTLGFSSASALTVAGNGYQVRVLDTARPAGNLMSRSRPVALAAPGAVESALLTDGGRTVVAFTPGSGGEALDEFSARTGRLLRVLAQLPAGAQTGAAGTVLSADPSGQHLLISGFETRRLPSPPPGWYLPSAADGMVFGRVDDGRFTALPDPVALQSQTGVW